MLKSLIGIGYFLYNHQKSPKKRNYLKFRNDLWVSTVYKLNNNNGHVFAKLNSNNPRTKIVQSRPINRYKNRVKKP
mgnify:CR=1 FL=1